MNRKLEEIYQRYEKLGELLADRETLSDMSLWQKYAKERSDIEETANKYAEYKNAETESATLESELKTESDKEMKDLLESELEDCKKRLSAIKGELKILLLPKNPDDDKNVIVEIRALRSVQLHFDELFGNFFRRNLIADGFKRYSHTRRLRAESVPRRKSLRTFRAAEKSGKLAVAYFEILAVDASEITTAEKNRSASSGAADYRFFPFMDTDVSYDYIVADSAEARGNFAIDSAFPRT